MLRTVATLTSIVLLVGCTPTISLHNPNSIPEAQLAKVSAEDTGLWPGDHESSASIVKAYDSQGKVVIQGDSWLTGYPKTVSLAEGEYHFVIRCDTRNVYNYQRIKINLNAGNAYTAYCLANYEPWLFSDRVALMRGYISSNSDLESDKAKHKERLDNYETR